MLDTTGECKLQRPAGEINSSNADKNERLKGDILV